MRFHSQIHALANISTHQPYELRPETIEVLRKKHRDLVESLSDMPDNQKNWHFRTPLVKYSKVLRRMINNRVFSSFKHLSLTQ
jgi:hypothetical protein